MSMVRKVLESLISIQDQSTYLALENKILVIICVFLLQKLRSDESEIDNNTTI